MKVFAGRVDDPFCIDLGAAFDTLNLRTAVNGGVLTPAQDAAQMNFVSDTDICALWRGCWPVLVTAHRR